MSDQIRILVPPGVATDEELVAFPRRMLEEREPGTTKWLNEGRKLVAGPPERELTANETKLSETQRRIETANAQTRAARAELRQIGTPVVDEAIERGLVQVTERDRLLDSFAQSPQATRDHLEALGAKQRHDAFAADLAARYHLRPEELI